MGSEFNAELGLIKNSKIIKINFHKNNQSGNLPGTN